MAKVNDNNVERKDKQSLVGQGKMKRERESEEEGGRSNITNGSREKAGHTGLGAVKGAAMADELHWSVKRSLAIYMLLILSNFLPLWLG